MQENLEIKVHSLFLEPPLLLLSEFYKSEGKFFSLHTL